jgi:phosphoglycolate phosphatase
MRRALFLFDIDGTLLHGDDTGRVAFRAAFEAVLGDASGLAGVGFGGRTDLAIVRLAAAAQGLPDLPEATVAAVLAAYRARMVAACTPPEAPATPFIAIPAAIDAVRAVSPLLGPRLGLGTGNVAAIADLKVDQIGLAENFYFGGYGDDAEDRAALLRVGFARGLARNDLRELDAHPIVVGDTLRDIAAARAIGASVIAVTTGSGTRAALAEAAPDLLLDALSDSALLRFMRERDLT